MSLFLIHNFVDVIVKRPGIIKGHVSQYILFVLFGFALLARLVIGRRLAAVDNLRAGSEVKVEEDEESDPSDATDDHEVLGPVGQSHSADGVKAHPVRRPLPARQAVEIEILFIVIRRAQVRPLGQSLFFK